MQWCQFAALLWAAVAVPLQPASTLRSKRRIDAATTLRGGFGGALLESYTNLLAKAPLRTNMVTAACLAMTSDCTAQKLCADDGKAEACAPYDYPRTAWIALWGSVVSGAMLQQWFVLLRYLFPLYKTSNWQLAGKVFVNQLVMSPGLNAGCSPVWQSTRRFHAIDATLSQVLRLRHIDARSANIAFQRRQATRVRPEDTGRFTGDVSALVRLLVNRPDVQL